MNNTVVVSRHPIAASYQDFICPESRKLLPAQGALEEGKQLSRKTVFQKDDDPYISGIEQELSCL